MSYAIISLGGKQYRVSEGQRLLVDRLPTEDGKTFTPDVLLVGGDGAPRSGAEGRHRHGQGARPAARPEDPDRQVQEAHRLQAPHGVPLRPDADRDRVDRREEEGCGEAEAHEAEAVDAAAAAGRGRGEAQGGGEAEGGAEAAGAAKPKAEPAAEPDVAAETAKEDES